MERLQKIISQAGIASRRQAEVLIQEGKVTVNGKVVTELGMKANPFSDKIKVNGKPLQTTVKQVYFLLNKPKGYLSTVRDDRERKTVMELFPDVKERIFPVGRLDRNTEGLLLMTNDGELMNTLLHPKFEIHKTYMAKVSGCPTEEKLDRLRAGVVLEDGLTAPAKVYVLEQDGMRDLTTIEITIHEGRNRQIRRMFTAIGHDVKALKRTEFAGLTLSGIKRGQYRELTANELKHLRSF